MADPGAAAFLRSHPAITVIRDPDRFPPQRDGLHRARLSGTRIADRDALFDVLSSELRFPDWFGRNWDALHDTLSDLAWIEADGIALLVTGAADLFKREPLVAAHLVAIWGSAALAQAERRTALQLYLAFER